MYRKIIDMLGKTESPEAGKGKSRERGVLSLELAEVKDISDLIFKRLEKKIEVLEAIEASVDEKIARLERLIHRAEAIKPVAGGLNREHEIMALKHRGLKIDEIADIIDMPVGEIELVLNLNPEMPEGKSYQ